MSLTYTTGIPAAANNPSVDQPNMQVNTNSISTWTLADHIGFNTANGGQHNQVRFPAVTTPVVSAPSGTASVLYSIAGVADNAHAVVAYQNAELTFPIALIRAYAVFVGSTGAIASSQSIGVASVVRTSAGNYTVTLNANVVTGTTYGVFTSASGFGPTASVTISSATVFALDYGAIDPTNAFFFVTQL